MILTAPNLRKLTVNLNQLYSELAAGLSETYTVKCVKSTNFVHCGQKAVMGQLYRRFLTSMSNLKLLLERGCFIL